MLFALAAGAAMSMAAGSALAAETLGWSHAQVGVGSCSRYAPGGCEDPSHPPSLSETYQFGYNHNHAISGFDASRGEAFASSGVGSGFAALPELKAFVEGRPDLNGAYSWNYAFVQGVIGYRWDGPTTEIDLDTFVGTLDFLNLGGYVGYANASLALLYDDVEDVAIGTQWARDNSRGGFSNGCSAAGAGGIATTGPVSQRGSFVERTTSQLCDGSFTLTEGENFYIWARLETFIAGDGTVDASNTFTVDFGDDVDTELRELIVANSTRIEGGPGIAVPEPATWALMIAGFGGVGAALRRRARALAA